MECLPGDVRRIIWHYYFDARRQEMEPYLTAHKAFMENSHGIIRAIPLIIDDDDDYSFNFTAADVLQLVKRINSLILIYRPDLVHIPQFRSSAVRADAATAPQGPAGPRHELQ